MTGKKVDLSKCIGQIVRNSTGHIVGAEAMTFLFGLKFNPELNAEEGRLVSCTTLPKYNTFVKKVVIIIHRGEIQ